MAVRRHNVHWDITADDQASRALQAVEGNLNRVNGAAESIRRTFSSALVATALVTFTRESARAAMEAEQSQMRVAAALKATGHQAGLTASQLDEMAESLAETTQFDDESLRGAQATLLKFGNIYGDVFRRAMGLSADLAAFMGTSVADAAQMLGKSLQSPTEGLTMMERQFGKLTPAQEEHIKSLVRQGKAVEAQVAVLELWQSKIGGTAELMNTGLKKSSGDVAKSWNEMLEAMGKTEFIGGRVNGVLGGTRDILNDLKRLADGAPTDPVKLQMQRLDALNRQIDNLERSRRERANQSRAYAGEDIADPEIARMDRRIADLKIIREQVNEATRVLMTAGDRSNMDARDRRLFDPRPVVLGGSAGGGDAESEAARAKRLAEIAKQRAEAEMAYAKGLRDVNQGEEEQLATRLELADSTARLAAIRKNLIDTEVAYAEALQAMREGRLGEEEQLATRLETVAKKTKDVDDVARDLGFTFSSAFEDAIVNGEKLSEVLKSLEKDIARIILRKAVTEPLAGAIVSGIQGLFPGRAEGGAAIPNTWHMVGEKGPELAYFGPNGGHVVANDDIAGLAGGGRRGGDVYVSQSIHVDSRADRADVVAAIEASGRAVEARIRRSFRSGGEMARSVGLA